MTFWDRSLAKDQDMADQFAEEIADKEAKFARALGVKALTKSQKNTVFVNWLRSMLGLKLMPYTLSRTFLAKEQKFDGAWTRNSKLRRQRRQVRRARAL